MEMKVCKDLGILSKDVEEYPEEGEYARDSCYYSPNERKVVHLSRERRTWEKFFSERQR